VAPVSPFPKTVIFRLLSDQVLNIFQEKIKKNALDTLRVLFSKMNLFFESGDTDRSSMQFF